MPTYLRLPYKLTYLTHLQYILTCLHDAYILTYIIIYNYTYYYHYCHYYRYTYIYILYVHIQEEETHTVYVHIQVGHLEMMCHPCEGNHSGPGLLTAIARSPQYLETLEPEKELNKCGRFTPVEPVIQGLARFNHENMGIYDISG